MGKPAGFFQQFAHFFDADIISGFEMDGFGVPIKNWHTDGGGVDHKLRIRKYLAGLPMHFHFFTGITIVH